jgi:SulP family sulfate permease
MAFFRPVILDSFKDYSRAQLSQDILAGITVGIIALPLAMAFAIASGLKPEAGIFAAIVGGLIVALLGGTKVQIAGPAGAFIVIVYAIVDRYGVANLLLATTLSGVFLFLMGLFRLGTLVRFIPSAVIVGFTNGIAVLIILSQIKDFFGLQIDKLPSQFFSMSQTLIQYAPTWNPTAIALSLSSLGILLVWRIYKPLLGKLALIPGTIVVLVLATLITSIFSLPIETIGSRFGGIPSGLPSPQWQGISWESAQFMIAPAMTLALLGAIESLLCARIADGLTHDRHRPNQELMGQGLANFCMPFFGGMPVTGTIARTVTNIESGARTPISAIVHSLTLLFIILLAAPLAKNIPLACLAAILIFIAWNMGDWKKFIDVKQFRLPYRLTLLSVFLLTIMVDLTVAVQVGLILAFITFIYRISSLSRIEKANPEDYPLLKDLDQKVGAYRIYGALFFGAVQLLEKIEKQLPQNAVVLDFKNVIYIDSTGMESLIEFMHHCQTQGVSVYICGLNHQTQDIASRSGLYDKLSSEFFCHDLVSGLQKARKIFFHP